MSVSYRDHSPLMISYINIMNLVVLVVEPVDMWITFAQSLYL